MESQLSHLTKVYTDAVNVAGLYQRKEDESRRIWFQSSRSLSATYQFSGQAVFHDTLSQKRINKYIYNVERNEHLSEQKEMCG